MKTRYYILTTLAMALLAVSCQKAAVGGAQEPEEAPVPIQLTTNLKVNSVSVTKAAVDVWNEQKLYIYAIPTSGTDELQVKNVEVVAPESGTEGELTLKKDEETNYYYPANSSTYDFYGYYVDGAGGASTPQDNQGDNVFKLQITLDGSQDVMLAKADKEKDTAAKGIAPTHAYSAYSARKEVVPNLKFEHQLARFVFRVAAGNQLGEKVEIQGVKLSSNSKANLVITGTNRGIEDASNPEDFDLKNDEGVIVTTGFPASQAPYESTEIDFSTVVPIGESIMVIPADSHEMDITLRQKSASGEEYLGDPFHIIKNLTSGMVVKPDGTQYESGVFLPGYQYNVNIVVYGRQEVKVYVTLSEWKVAGNIKIDDDKEWGDNEPKLGLKATNQTSQKVYYLYFYANPIAAGTEVKVWNPAQNVMVPAEPGTYKFETQQDGKEYVKLEEVDGKTVVEDLYVTNPDDNPVS